MIKLKDKSVSAYKGDLRPVEVFKNTEKLHGYNITGTNLNEAEFEKTYNDYLTVYGKSSYGDCKNLCPPPKSKETNDGEIYTRITKRVNGKFDLEIIQVDTSNVVILMSPIELHSVKLPAGTYTASSNSEHIGFCSDDEFLYDLPHTFTLDKEQTVYFGTYNIGMNENSVYIQVEKGENATEYQPYFDPNSDASPDNIKSILSSSGKIETFGQNLFYKGEKTPPTTGPISCVWDEVNQTITLNGTATNENSNGGYNLTVSTPMNFDLNQGTDIINIRNLVSGKCKLEGTAKLIWSIFSNGTISGNYYSARIVEAYDNVNSKRLYKEGVVPVVSGSGYNYILQISIGTNGSVSFDNAVYKIQILKGNKTKPYSPYYKPSALEISELNGLEAYEEQNYKEEIDQESKYYLSDSLENTTLTKRVGERVFMAYDNIQLVGENENTIDFVSEKTEDISIGLAKPICNIFTFLENTDLDKEGFFVNDDGKFVFRVNKSRNIYTNLLFKDFIGTCKRNGLPLTILYPLGNTVENETENSIKTHPAFTRVKVTLGENSLPFGLTSCIKTE